MTGSGSAPASPRRRRWEHPHGAAAIALLGSGLVVVGAALPWVRLGHKRRSAFTLLRVASEIGALDSTLRRLGVAVLLFTPVMVSTALLLFALNRRLLALLVTTGVGVIGLAIGALGLRVPGAQVGPKVTIGGGLLSFVACVLALFQSRLQSAGRTGRRTTT